MVKIDPIEHLQQTWRECDQHNQALHREIQRLQTLLAEADRRREIAVQNAFEDGYWPACDDARRGFIPDGKNRDNR